MGRFWSQTNFTPRTSLRWLFQVNPGATVEGWQSSDLLQRKSTFSSRFKTAKSDLFWSADNIFDWRTGVEKLTHVVLKLTHGTVKYTAKAQKSSNSSTLRSWQCVCAGNFLINIQLLSRVDQAIRLAHRLRENRNVHTSLVLRFLWFGVLQAVPSVCSAINWIKGDQQAVTDKKW